MTYSMHPSFDCYYVISIKDHQFLTFNMYQIHLLFECYSKFTAQMDESISVQSSSNLLTS